MEFIPVKTRTLLPPRDDLFAVLDESLTDVQDGDIVLITSKVLAIHQGRCVPKAEVSNKDALIRSEAEKYIERDTRAKYPIMLTIKHHTLIASAGIDESNANGYYILWPEHIDRNAKELWQYIRAKHGVKDLGVIITDSHSLPLRWGVLGVAIGFYGFEPMVNLIGKNDLFGRPLVMTRQNIPDALAAMGVFLMGEADESTPALIVRGMNLRYTDKDVSQQFWVEEKDDMYGALLKIFKK